MKNFAIHSVDPNAIVRVVRDQPELPPALDARVEALWNRASDRVQAGGAGRLFNGQVFSIDAITPGTITGHLSEYRRLVAQMENNALFADLGIRSLSVCGVLCCPGGVVIGRRHPSAVYQPGMWQLCPAGSVDAGVRRADGTMDFRSQILTELHEELGLLPDSISDVTPLCIVEHAGSHVSDFGILLHTALDPDVILSVHLRHGDREYDPVRIVPAADLPAFISRAGASLVPAAPIFLSQAGLLPQDFSPPTGP